MRNNNINKKGASNVKFMDQPKNSKAFSLADASITYYDDEIPDNPFDFQVSEDEAHQINNTKASSAEVEKNLKRGRNLRLGRLAILARVA